MKRQTTKQRDILYYVLVVLIAAAIGIGSGWNLDFWSENKEYSVTLADARKLFPEAVSVELSEEATYEVFSTSEKIGECMVSPRIQGYGGDIQLVIGSSNGVISSILLLPNYESSEFRTYISNEKLIERWNGASLNDAYHRPVDIVSGATTTSRSIIYAVRQTLDPFAVKVQTLAAQETAIDYRDILFVAVLLASLHISYTRSLRKYRTYYLVTVFVVIGLLTGKALSLKAFHGWLLSGLSWSANWQGTLLLVTAFGMPLLKKPMFYCTYLCPLGAFQELISKAVPRKRKSISASFMKLSLGDCYFALIWSALILGISPELGHLEPFMAFSYTVANYLFFVAIAIIGVLSIFITKPWCAVCPTGYLLKTVTHTRRSATKKGDVHE